MSEILTYKKYKEIIETCEMLLSPETIRSHVAGYHTKYQQDNPLMSLALMEIIEHEYPEIDLIENQIIEEISIFDDLGQSIDRPQLRYLFTLLFHGNYLEPSQPTDAQLIKPIKGNESYTFESDYNEPELLKIYNWLIKENYITEFSENYFVALFSKKESTALAGEKLKWNLSNTYGNDNETLFTILFEICPKEFPNNRYYRDYLKKIITFISPVNSEAFNYNALRKAFSTYRKNSRKSPRNSNTNKILPFLNQL